MIQPTPTEVQDFITQSIECQYIEVTGDGRHFYAQIVAASFEGLSRIKRHQLVYAALGDKMQADIHALSLQTLTPQEWRDQASQA